MPEAAALVADARTAAARTSASAAGLALDERDPRALFLDAGLWSIHLDGTDPPTPRVIVLERTAPYGSGTGKVLGVAHLGVQFPLLDGETD